MLVAVLSGFTAAAAAPWLHRLTRSLTGWLLSLLPFGLMAYFISFIPAVASGTVLEASYPWAPSLGLNLAFRLDGLSLLFALLITGIGGLVMIYASQYLAGHRYLGRFYAFILAFMASMLGLVLTNNLIALFVFWELTSLTSYFLIGFDFEREESRQAALQALIVTSAGGLALLAGLVILGLLGGSFQFSELVAQADQIRAHPLYLPALLLILLGAFSKSAQFPFHFWLPGAMEAPAPVSAYLHSATMVKAGIYLLARLTPTLGDTSAWITIVTVVGAATVVIGGLLALFSTDLKLILAYSTISSLGTMVLLLGVGGSGAIQAALVFLLAHALYKGALFMIAGILDHETGERDVERLGGLRRAMPFTLLAAGLAAVSLAGLGPVLSFIGKELLFEALLEVPGAAVFLVPAAVIAAAVSVAVALIVVIRPFFGTLKPTPKTAHEASFGFLLGPVVLSLAGLLTGLFPTTIAASLVAPAVAAVFGEPVDVVLQLWHGFNIALGLSVVSILLGLLTYRGWKALRLTSTRLEWLLRRGPSWWYKALVESIFGLARVQTRFLQNGYLRYYLLTIILTTILLTGYALVSRYGLILPQRPIDLRYYEVAIGILILMATLAAVRARSRLGAVAALGVVGYGVSMIFILFGAPDIAMTQFMVETLTVILLVLVFYHLPPLKPLSRPASRLRDLSIALAAGALMTTLVLVAANLQYFTPISEFFVEQSLPLGHGRNIVNVILVGFRAFDTMGEITVLALAGIGVYALLKLRPKKGDRE